MARTFCPTEFRVHHAIAEVAVLSDKEKLMPDIDKWELPTKSASGRSMTKTATPRNERLKEFNAHMLGVGASTEWGAALQNGDCFRLLRLNRWSPSCTKSSCRMFRKLVD